jgi:CheY-like chemotaxis protein
LDRASILLVDDRPENLLALEAILAPLGQNLVRAQSPTGASVAVAHGSWV